MNIYDVFQKIEIWAKESPQVKFPGILDDYSLPMLLVPSYDGKNGEVTMCYLAEKVNIENYTWEAVKDS